MPRILLPSPYDLGFLELRIDGSVKTKFRIRYLHLCTDWADLHTNPQNSILYVCFKDFQPPIYTGPRNLDHENGKIR
jgi:hypothetical protein